jgi:integrase
VNKPRPVYNRAGDLIGYKQEVKWRGHRRYFTRRTYAAAERCWALAVADFEAGKEPYDRYRQKQPERETRPINFGEWLDEWHPRRHLSDQARKNQTSLIKARVKPDLGHLPLTNEGFTQPHIQAWVWELEEEYAPRYVRTLLSHVRVALRHAVRDPNIALTVSPVSEIQLEPLDSTGRRSLSPEQAEAIVSRCGVHEHLFRSLAFTGARLGELIKRDVDDWSWRTGITISARRVEVPTDDRPRKRKTGTRKAPASKSAAGGRVIELCPSHNAETRDYLDGRDAGSLYLGRDGRPSRGAAYQMFAKAVKEAREAHRKQEANNVKKRRAGKPPETSAVDVPEGVSPHWLRHTHKTWLRDAKCDPVAINERIGHKTEGMDGIYVHPTDAMRVEILEVLEVIWAQARNARVEPEPGARRLA